MADPWIRVHAQLRGKPVVARLAAALRINPFQAMGHLVCFWGNVAAHATNGDVSSVPDSLIDHWAGWTSKRASFSKWVREHHLDEDGRVREWDDYAGALEQRRAKERQRLADKRNLLRNNVRTVAQQSATNVQLLQDVATRARERNGTERDGTVELQEQGVRDRTPAPEWVGLAREQWAAKLGPLKPSRIKTVLGPLVTAHGWEATSKGMADYLTATPGGKARLEWFAERGTYWVKLAAMPLTDPQTCQPTERMRVVVDGKVA